MIDPFIENLFFIGHFVQWFIIGYFFLSNWIIFFILSIGWEILEFFISVLSDNNLIVKLTKETPLNKFLDLIVNTIAFYLAKILKSRNGEKNK